MTGRHVFLLTAVSIMAGATALACSAADRSESPSHAAIKGSVGKAGGYAAASPFDARVSTTPSASTSDNAATAPPSTDVLGGRDLAISTTARSRPAASLAPEAPSVVQALPSAMLIRQGTASVQVDSLDVGLRRVREIARRIGAVIANTQMQTGKDELHSASIELRMPSERFDDAVSGLSPIGKLEAVNVSVEDVGEEYVDVNARMTNAHRLEERLIDLLAHRTGKLADVLEVEHELARVREEIERYDGRLRYLRTRASISTLTVTVHEPAPIVSPPGQNPIREAFKQSWRNLVDITAGLIASLGVLVPLGLLLGGLVWIGRRHLPWAAKS
jgi:acetolactate synthase regulatory subunit